MNFKRLRIGVALGSVVLLALVFQNCSQFGSQSTDQFAYDPTSLVYSDANFNGEALANATLTSDDAKTCYENFYAVSEWSNASDLDSKSLRNMNASEISSEKLLLAEAISASQSPDIVTSRPGWYIEARRTNTVGQESSSTTTLKFISVGLGAEEILTCVSTDGRAIDKVVELKPGLEPVLASGLIRTDKHFIACRPTKAETLLAFSSNGGSLTSFSGKAFVLRRGCSEAVNPVTPSTSAQGSESQESVSRDVAGAKNSDGSVITATAAAPPVPSLYMSVRNGSTVANGAEIADCRITPGTGDTASVKFKIIDAQGNVRLDNILFKDRLANCRVGGLNVSTKYTLRAIAISATGSESAPSPGITFTTAPARPDGVIVTNDGPYTGTPDPSDRNLKIVFNLVALNSVQPDTYFVRPSCGDVLPGLPRKDVFANASPVFYGPFPLGYGCDFYLVSQILFPDPNDPNSTTMKEVFSAESTKNPSDPGSRIVLDTVPYSSPEVTAVTSGDASITFTFKSLRSTGDEAGQSALTGYDVIDALTGDTIASIPISGVIEKSSNTKTIAGPNIVNGRLYAISIKARNKNGVGPGSTCTATQGACRAAPDRLPVSPATAQAEGLYANARISFTVPPENIAERTVYEVEAQQGTAPWSQAPVATGGSSPLTTTALIPDTNYRFRVRAVLNSVDGSKKYATSYSSPSNFVSTALRAPSITIDPSVYRLKQGDPSVIIPVKDANGSPITCTPSPAFENGISFNNPVGSDCSIFVSTVKAIQEKTYTIKATNSKNSTTATVTIGVSGCVISPIKSPLKSNETVSLNVNSANVSGINMFCRRSPDSFPSTGFVLSDSQGAPVLNNSNLSVGMLSVGTYECQTNATLVTPLPGGVSSLSCNGGNLVSVTVQQAYCQAGYAPFNSQTPNALGKYNTCVATWTDQIPNSSGFSASSVTDGGTASAVCLPNLTFDLASIQTSCPVLPTNKCPGGVFPSPGQELKSPPNAWGQTQKCSMRWGATAVGQNASTSNGYFKSPGYNVSGVCESNSSGPTQVNVMVVSGACPPPPLMPDYPLNIPPAPPVPESYPFGGTPPPTATPSPTPSPTPTATPLPPTPTPTPTSTPRPPTPTPTPTSTPRPPTPTPTPTATPLPPTPTPTPTSTPLPPTPTPTPTPTPVPTCSAGSQTITSATNAAGVSQTCNASWGTYPATGLRYSCFVTNGGSMSAICNTAGQWVEPITYCPPPPACASGTQEIGSAPNNAGTINVCIATWGAKPNSGLRYTATVTLGGSMSAICDSTGNWVSVETFCPKPADVAVCPGGTSTFTSADGSRTCTASWGDVFASPNRQSATVTGGGSMSAICNSAGQFVDVQSYCPPL